MKTYTVVRTWTITLSAEVEATSAEEAIATAETIEAPCLLPCLCHPGWDVEVDADMDDAEVIGDPYDPAEE